MNCSKLYLWCVDDGLDGVLEQSDRDDLGVCLTCHPQAESLGVGLLYQVWLETVQNVGRIVGIMEVYPGSLEVTVN